METEGLSDMKIGTKPQRSGMMENSNKDHITSEIFPTNYAAKDLKSKSYMAQQRYPLHSWMVIVSENESKINQQPYDLEKTYIIKYLHNLTEEIILLKLTSSINFIKVKTKGAVFFVLCRNLQTFIKL